MASYSHYGQRAATIGPDSICRIRLPGSVSAPFFSFSFFSKEDHIMQNRPGSDLDGLVRVWPNTSGLEASWCAGIIGPGFWQDATGPLPVSHFKTLGCVLPHTAQHDHIKRKTRPDPDLVLADRVIYFGQTDPVRKQAGCARIIRPASGQCFPADPGRMQIGSGIFTGLDCPLLPVSTVIFPDKSKLIRALSRICKKKKKKKIFKNVEQVQHNQLHIRELISARYA